VSLSRRQLLQATASASLLTVSGALAIAVPGRASGAGSVDLRTTYTKYVVLARRKSGLTLDEFKRYYENHHSKLLLSFKDAPLARYLRRYLHPQQHLDPGSAGEAHDVIAELWCNSPAEMDRLMSIMAEPAAAELFAKDEEHLFDRQSMKTYRVEEHETDLTTLSSAAASWRARPIDNVVKSILIAYRRPDLSTEEFKDYYENHHSKVVNDLSNPPLLRYFRRYLYPQTDFDPQPGGTPPSVIMEMWYRNRADMDAVDRSFYESPKVDLYIQDEARLFDRASMRYYVAEEHESILHRRG
jgi:EthD domain